MLWRDGDLWIAAAIDLGLAAQGHTCNATRDALHAQIVSYVRDAMTRDAAHAAVLLARKSPFADRLLHMIGRIGLGARSAYTEQIPQAVLSSA